MSATADIAAPARLAATHEVTVAHGRGDSRVLALDAVDFAIAEGETVALWGPSGSGKTTLLHVLGGLVTPAAGEVRWRDTDMVELNQSARGAVRAEGIGYVFQSANLLPHFTAYENVAFAVIVTGHLGDGSNAEELLELVGLGDKLDALPGELSGGEAQRCAIARALAQRPSLMLCDEPTGQLDSDTSVRVLDLIGALQAELGFALVTATHDRTVADRHQRVVRLLDGCVQGRETA